MAKYYGVREGNIPGVYDNWKECEDQIKGYPGAEYKKFKTREEAIDFINAGQPVETYSIDEVGGDRDLVKRIEDLEEEVAGLELRLANLEDRLLVERGILGADREGSQDEDQITMDLSQLDQSIGANEMVAYVDGSYRKDSGEYSYGMVIFTQEGQEEYKGKYKDELSSMRNVAGEIRGAEEAMKKAIELGKDKLYLYYDYLGIEKWAKEEWKANKKGTQDYRDFYLGLKEDLDVVFIKVEAHSGDEYNELADSLAKEALGIK